MFSTEGKHKGDHPMPYGYVYDPATGVWIRASDEPFEDDDEEDLPED